MTFHDRKDAGQQLAHILSRKYASEQCIVYGLARGGVVIAQEIAQKMHMPLSLIVIRKIGHPYDPEYALAVLTRQGKLISDSEELDSVDKEWLKAEVEKEKKEIQRRLVAYNVKEMPIAGKIAILADDGIATGLTMLAAIADIKTQHPKKIIVAVPVAPKEMVQKLQKLVDDVVTVDIPQHFLNAISAYYEEFPQVTDEEVTQAMKNSK